MSAQESERPTLEGSTRWERVRALVEGALERPSLERAAYLASLERDPALVAEALALLEHEDDGAFEPPGVAELGQLMGEAGCGPEDDEEGAPERLGPYRLLRRIGAGGMGTVHLAVRDDGQFAKRVALKLVKRGMDTEEVLRRFEQERQLLASLDHPGIARVLDGGRCPDGRPYLVMELVEGVQIDTWCDRQASSVRERIELFCQVCDAVADAHRSLVVHRDIKPSNVLVTADGRPKLLDFGIAKVLDARRGFATIDLTATPLKLLTPAYASPEQVRGEPVTTASDVYSLGVMLYQLLTGRTPLRFETGSPAEIERVVCTVDPEPPSAVIASTTRFVSRSGPERDAANGDATRELAARRGATPKALRRVLSGDLDTIVLEALRKEPRRRYASAAELAADLRRYLAGMPVLARPDTLGYRASRFVRRNRAAAAAGALVLLSLVGGLAVATAQYLRAEDARQALARQLAVDQERASQLELLARDLEQQRGLAEAARAEAEESLTEVRGLNEALDRQRSLALQRLEDVRDFATSLVFDVHRALIPLEGAEKVLKQVVETGLESLDRLASGAAGDQQLQRDLVGAYLRMAEIQAADSQGGPEARRAAMTSLERALEFGESLLAASPDHVPNRYALGSALLFQGEMLGRQGRHDRAAESFERALAAAEPALEHTSPGISYLVSASLRGLGALGLDQGDLEGAEDLLERSARALEPALARLPRLGSSLAVNHMENARLAAARGDARRAVEELERGLERIEELLAREPDHGPWRWVRTNLRLELAALLPRVGRSSEAEAIARELEEELEDRLALRHAREQSLRLGLSVLGLRARLEKDAGRTAQAQALTRARVAMARELRDLDPSNVNSRLDLGTVLLREADLALELGAVQAASDTLEEGERHLQAVQEESPLPRARQGLLAARTLEARIAERRAADASSAAARRRHLEEALEAWRRAEKLQRSHTAIDPWGAPDPDLGGRVAGGIERCTEALAQEALSER